MGMPTLADIFYSTVKDIGINQKVPLLCVEVVFKKFGAEKRHDEFAKNRCGKKKPGGC